MHKMEGGGEKMDLRHEEITLGELWDNPKSRAVFQKKVPMMMKRPIQNRARSITLGQLADFLGSWLPASVIQEVIKELQKA